MSDISTGLWFDHSQPSVVGWTLTLPIDKGNLLLSGLTLLVTIAGTSCWSLVALLIHGSIARRRKNLHVVDLQHQVALRNSSGPLNTISDSFKIHQAWSRVKTRKLWSRTMTLAGPAIVIWTGFAAASVLTSRVANRGYGSVLARITENNCGNIVTTTTSTTGHDVQGAFSNKVINDTSQARNYVKNFYQGPSNSRTARSIFPVAHLPLTVETNADCPSVNQSRCSQGAITMQTDPLDSHEMLGINAKATDRVTVQIRTTCALVDVSDLSFVNNTVIEYNLGPALGSPLTYAYYTNAFVDQVGYQIRVQSAAAGDAVNSSNWHPISDFNRTDADMSIYFLSQNAVRYLSPVFDPLFLATREITPPTPGLQAYYLSNYYVNPLICADQYVVCNPTTSTCSSPSGVNGVAGFVGSSILGMNDVQAATAERIILSLSTAGTWNSVEALGVGALFASDHILSELVSTSLPNNQWQIEVLGWFQTSLAKFQATIVEYSYKANLSTLLSVASPYGLTPDGWLTTGKIQSYQDQCHSQLIQSAGEVQNFSFLGVMIIVCVSVVLALLNLLMPAILRLVSRRKTRWGGIAERARQADDHLHLLRMALTGANGHSSSASQWDLGAWDVPVMKGDATLSRPEMVQDLTTYYKN